MPDYVLSKKADEDLTDIYMFSLQHFGEIKAEAYLLSLEECFTLLAGQPNLGRKIDSIRQGYFRHEHASHSIFYKKAHDGIMIMRVLHQRMDFQRHF